PRQRIHGGSSPLAGAGGRPAPNAADRPLEVDSTKFQFAVRSAYRSASRLYGISTQCAVSVRLRALRTSARPIRRPALLIALVALVVAVGCAPQSVAPASTTPGTPPPSPTTARPSPTVTATPSASPSPTVVPSATLALTCPAQNGGSDAAQAQVTAIRAAHNP